MMEDLNARFTASYPQYQRQVESADTPEELLRVYADIRGSILRDWDLTLINDMYTFICTALAGKGNRARIADVKNLESMKPSLAINALVDTARQHGLDSHQYRRQARDYIAAYGDRCLNELKLETRTYRTDPALLDALVEQRMAEPPVQPHSQREENRRPGLFVGMAKTGIRNREVSRLNRSRIFGLSRAIFLKIGEYYARMGQLDTARDVFYLRLDELVGDAHRKSLVQRRKQEQLRYENAPAYSRLVFAEKIINRPDSGGESQLLSRPDTMTGIGTSPGKITGQVLVIHQPEDQLDTTGKILVTRSTDPGWVFLLQRAKGIISEKGSLLSHTAIISRELHKPAVVNVKDCTRLLRSGDWVELDADEGRITVIERCLTCEHI
jgi:pyruvate,water dikinase